LVVFSISEKAELFNSIHSYEIKLEEELSKKWVADEDVDECTKCNTTFGWTVRKVCYLVCFFNSSLENLFFHSIIVEIVRRFFVVIVQIIGYKVKNQSVFRIHFPKKKIKLRFLF